MCQSMCMQGISNEVKRYCFCYSEGALPLLSVLVFSALCWCEAIWAPKTPGLETTRSTGALNSPFCIQISSNIIIITKNVITTDLILS